MATFTATAARTGASAYGHGLASNGKTVYSEYTLTAALALNDVIQMQRVPKGAKIMDVTLHADDIDGGTTSVLAVGDGGDIDRFITGSTIGQAGGTTTAIVRSTGVGYEYTVEDTIDVTCTTAPTSGTTGTLKLIVRYLVP